MKAKFFLFFALAVQAFAANGLTVSTLTTAAAFETACIEAKYTNDDNANATVVVEYKRTTDSIWLPAYVPFVDRRTTLNGNSNAAHVNEARLSIFGLAVNTAYDVRVTLSDADGVTGTNPVVGSFTTLNDAPPTAVRTVNVSDNTTLAAALTGYAAGDDIVLAAGTYNARTFTLVGTSSAWIRLRAVTAGTVIVGTNSDIANSSYVEFQNLTFASGATSSFSVDSTSHHVMFYGCSFPTVASTAPALDYGDSGIKAYAGCYHVYALHCSFTSSGKAYNDGVFGFYVKAGPDVRGTFVINDCTISGTFRDGISNETNAWGDGYVNNCEMIRNTISDVLDDCIELDGDARNCRVLFNTLSKTTGDSTGSLISLSGINVGPCYIMYNWGRSTTGIVAFKMGSGDPGPVYIFHNSFDINGSGTSDIFSDVAGDPKSELILALNNAFRYDRYGIYRGGRSNLYDYNFHNPISTGYNTVANEYEPGVVTYSALSDLRSATGQETHGVQTTFTFASDGTINTGTGYVDSGVSLNNINTSNSARPSNGSAPDMGLVETGGGGITSIPKGVGSRNGHTKGRRNY